MRKLRIAALALCAMAVFCPWAVEGHGRLIEPPSRSTMWRYGFKTPPNYNDNQLFCGGVQVQWGQNGGKCGVCGDPWSGPLDNEPGGKYANGIIVRKYQTGQVIKVTVELTANHKGFFEYRLCPSNNPFKKITHECLNKFILPLAQTGETRYYVPDKGSYQKITVQLKLPEGLSCAACVLQWKYNAGNSWGTDPATGTSCVGCGSQEQFYGCADVAIGHDEIEVGKVPPKHPWYFEVETDWHWGIVGPVKNMTHISGSSNIHIGLKLFSFALPLLTYLFSMSW